MRLFYNAKFYSMDSDKIYNAVLIENGKFVKCFDEVPTGFNNWEKINLGGSFVLPGFIDTHTHSFEGGLYSLSCDLKNIGNIKNLLEKIREIKSIGNNIFAYQFDENLIEEKRFPTIEELDRVAPDKPLLLRRIDGHSCVVNSTAMKMIPWGEKFPKNFDGVLRYEYNDIAAHWFHRSIDNEGIFMAYSEAEKIAVKNGHTTVHTMVGDANNDPLHYKFLNDSKKRFNIEWILYPQMFDIKKALDLGAERIGGCILADGSFGSYTAAISEPYLGRDSTKGITYKSNQFWNDFVKEAHQNNLQVAVHAIGDVAIRQIINVYQKAQKDCVKDLRHQVIHCELLYDDMIKIMKENNITASMQPMFDRLWGGEGNFYSKVLGNERISFMNRLKSLIKADVRVGGGSDWYITPIDAKLGIDAAENIHNENESLSRKEAIKLYTYNASFLSHDENRLGSIKENKQADFIVVKENPFNIDSIKNLTVNKVIKKGLII